MEKEDNGIQSRMTKEGASRTRSDRKASGMMAKNSFLDVKEVRKKVG